MARVTTQPGTLCLTSSLLAYWPFKLANEEREATARHKWWDGVISISAQSTNGLSIWGGVTQALVVFHIPERSLNIAQPALIQKPLQAIKEH